jgi:hypothetical protein
VVIRDDKRQQSFEKDERAFVKTLVVKVLNKLFWQVSGLQRYQVSGISTWLKLQTSDLVLTVARQPVILTRFPFNYPANAGQTWIVYVKELME